MRVGVVILPEDRWNGGGRQHWLAAEELGFDHAWTYDHLAWRTLRDEAWFGAVPVLAAAAATTSTIRLGSLVASPNFRHPVPFARELLALDDLSDGRFTLGVGAGGEGWGRVDARRRPLVPWRADEPLRGVRRAPRPAALRAARCSFAGRFYDAVGARSYPGCVQQPRLPFAIAATGARGMAIAARFGATWVTTGERTDGEPADASAGADQVRRQIARLEAACAGVGRDPSTIGRLVLLGPSLAQGLSSAAEFEDTLGRYADAGATDVVVHWPRHGDPYRGRPGDVRRRDQRRPQALIEASNTAMTSGA